MCNFLGVITPQFIEHVGTSGEPPT
jgi:hypothetical protein